MAAAAALCLAAAGCTDAAAGDRAATPAVESGPVGSGPAEVDELTFAVVGDSLTAGLGEPLDGVRVRGTGSWVPAAQQPDVRLVGGWAVPGATTADMRAGFVPVPADVLVVLGGTNDLLEQVPWEESRANLLAVVAEAGVDDVLVLAVPPLQAAPASAAGYDFRLAALAADQGWDYLDPWHEVSTGTGWVPGASDDGVHPTQAVADRVGELVGEELLTRSPGDAD